MTTALDAHVGAAHHYFSVIINPATVFVDPTTFMVIDFGGLSLTSPIRPTAPRTGTGAGTYAAAVATTPAQIATATAEALAAQ